MASQPAAREPAKDPVDVLAEAEQQWLFTEDELLRSPSIIDGMKPEEEIGVRGKGVNFILQVGIMLRLPQITLSAAAVFFNRYLMRRSLVEKKDYKPLHHYQVAAISLFLATKVEEHTRKIKELIIGCCRVAQKNPALIVDDQTRDYWRWRDTILLNEDVVLEVLCFDLTIESPYKILFELVKYYNVSRNHKLRDAAWSFINDSSLTQMCLLYPSRTIACAALYVGAKHADFGLPDEQGKPWWTVQRAKLRDMRRACNYMASWYGKSHLKPGMGESAYTGLRTPEDGDEENAKTRLRGDGPIAVSPARSATSGGFGMERSESQQSLKREREDDDFDGERGEIRREEVMRVEKEEEENRASNGQSREEPADGSEEGELEE
ncbi:cyclin-like protein [Rhizodiscina lignyota]|uniref:RNA polymerase II holoenzyme cyclin-like subunit n=1 Tax=Rhizodiscina lignyota TaxID=1504668 RepID=A0A9P4IBH2_9PEZI|nr:cyclin-like protein [Rhizodiscina lignyota]